MPAAAVRDWLAAIEFRRIKNRMELVDSILYARAGNYPMASLKEERQSWIDRLNELLFIERDPEEQIVWGRVRPATPEQQEANRKALQMIMGGKGSV
jgi:hypothetical protein